jgi:hypothetical protein
MLWVAPLGTISCLIAGLAGGAMSRDAHCTWFALTPLLVLPTLLSLAGPWPTWVAILWVVAAGLGANVVRRTVSPTGGSG